MDGDSTDGEATHVRPGHARRQLADRLVLARAQQSRGDLDAALVTLAGILEDGRALGGATVLTARRMLAEIHLDLHHTGYAHELAEALFDDCAARLGAAHPATVRAACLLAAAYHRLGDLDAAQRLCQQVVAVADPQRAPGRRALLLSRVLLAQIAADHGAAIGALAESFDEFRDRYGDADLDALRIAARLADRYASTGELAAARRVLTRAHHAATGRLGPAHPLTTELDARLLRVEPPMPTDEPPTARRSRRTGRRTRDSEPRRVTAWHRWWPLRARPPHPQATAPEPNTRESDPALPLGLPADLPPERRADSPSGPLHGTSGEPSSRTDAGPPVVPAQRNAEPPTAVGPRSSGAPEQPVEPRVRRAGPWDLPPRRRLAPGLPRQRGHATPNGTAPHFPVPFTPPQSPVPFIAPETPAPFTPPQAPTPPRPRERTSTPRRSRALQRRGLPLWGLLAATIFAAGVAVDIGTHHFPYGRVPASAATTASDRPTGGFQAQQLIVRDGATPDALAVTWFDPSGGSATPVVAIATATGQTVAVATLPPGTSSYAPRGLDPNADYCAIVALYADPTDTSATAARACLHRRHT